ncbi:MAG: hypothetical protein GDA52_06550 [Rhodobacteraceae bacterium]|nr:hypothetical protein [Paracoccaceae bacterium]
MTNKEARRKSDAATDLTRDDIRAAVGAGMMSEAQAVSLIALADMRRGARAHISGTDEPFELFRGFNEIFIVVGLVILYSGWWGLTGPSLGRGAGGSVAWLYPVLAMGAVVLLARYFTLTRRMVAPSITLTIFFGLGALQLGLTIAWILDATFSIALVLGVGLSTLLLGGYYWIFRVPFTMALVAIGVFGTAFGLVTLDGTIPSDPSDLFLLTGEGPFAILTFVLGLVGLVIAMRFDMSDPHRITRRSASGFWLHIIAAPAIVNTVALSLFDVGSVLTQLLLVGFVALMAILAIIIDRRSLLVSGVGYIVALSFTVMEGSTYPTILLFGLGLIVLGAKWDVLRTWLMQTLPGFPGKDRLPPWTLMTSEETST